MNRLVILISLILAFSAGKAFSEEANPPIQEHQYHMNMQMMDHSKMNHSEPIKTEKVKSTEHSKHKTVKNNKKA